MFYLGIDVGKKWHEAALLNEADEILWRHRFRSNRSGLEAARAEGRVGGRRRSLSRQQEEEAVEMVRSGRKSGAEAARLFQVHPSTISRLLAQHG